MTTGNLEGRAGDGRIGRVVFSEERIRERVAQLGREITEHYGSGGDLVVVGLLKGSFIFLADLVRAIERPLQVDFLVAASYGAGTVSSGEVRLLYGPRVELRGRRVLVVEDILDSGNTVNRVMPELERHGPRSLDLCALLRKGGGSVRHPPRWVGFDAPDDFLVGYGLDHAEELRHLPFIAALQGGGAGFHNLGVD